MKLCAVCLFVVLVACGRVTPPGDQRAGLPAVRHDEHVFAGGAAPQAVRWENPYRRDKRAADAGAKIFTAMNCDGCHGGAGVGWVGPSLADGRWRFGGADGEIFQSIYYGRPHGMPAYGGLLLAPDAVWKLVTCIQSHVIFPPAPLRRPAAALRPFRGSSGDPSALCPTPGARVHGTRTARECRPRPCRRSLPGSAPADSPRRRTAPCAWRSARGTCSWTRQSSCRSGD